jgi:hypothetical protein
VPDEQRDRLEALDVIRDSASVDAWTPATGPNMVSEILQKRDTALQDAPGGLTLQSLAF